jgi:hypothetical protein
MIVYKYKLERQDDQRARVTMPHSAVVLSAGFQDGEMFIWASIPRDAHLTEVRSFLILWTGETADVFPSEWEHVATLTDSDGLVYHIFQ